MSRSGRPAAIPDNELALAYELRQAGITWKWIAYGLGVSWKALRSAVARRCRPCSD